MFPGLMFPGFGDARAGRHEPEPHLGFFKPVRFQLQVRGIHSLKAAKSLLFDKPRAGSALWHKITFEQGSAALRALSIGPLFFFSRRD